MQIQKISTPDKIAHVPFRKVIKFDLMCMAIDAVMGIGSFPAIHI